MQRASLNSMSMKRIALQRVREILARMAAQRNFMVWNRGNPDSACFCNFFMDINLISLKGAISFSEYQLAGHPRGANVLDEW